MRRQLLCNLLHCTKVYTHLAFPLSYPNYLHKPFFVDHHHQKLCTYVQKDVKHNRNERQQQQLRNHNIQQRLMWQHVRWLPTQQRRPASIARHSQLTQFLLDDGSQFLDGHVVTLFDGRLDDLLHMRIERHRGYAIGNVVRADGL